MSDGMWDGTFFTEKEKENVKHITRDFLENILLFVFNIKYYKKIKWL